MKLPPNDIKLEMAVLGSILTSPEGMLTAMELVSENSFYNTRNQIIYKHMLGLFKDGHKTDIITLGHKLRNNTDGIPQSFIIQLVETVPISANLEEYCKLLSEIEYRRNLFNLASQFQEGLIDVEKFINKIIEIPSQNIVQEETLSELFLATLKKATEGVAYKLGFESLNHYIGGIDHGELIVIGGHTSQGKTMFALQIAMDLADKNLKVLYCTAEMTQIETARRILANHNRINITDFRKGIIDDRQKENIKKASEYLGKIWDIKIRNVYYTEDVKRFVLKYDPDVVIVDHLHNMGRPETGLSQYVIRTENIADLQTLALQTKKPIIVLSQFRRKHEKDTSEPQLSDLRDSGAIEEKANIILFVYWKNQLRREVKPRKGGEPPERMDIIVAKNRDGVIGRIPMAFFPEYSLIRDFEKKEYEEYYD